MNEYSSLLDVATNAVSIGCRLIREQKPGVLTAKGDRDYASNVDYMIEGVIREYLANKTPEIGFLGEEEGATNRDADLLWLLDPIDGTVNFVHGLPLCAVSLGLVRQGRTVLGVVELPFLGGQYSAVEGGGSYIGTERIQVSKTASLKDAVISIGDYAVGVDASRKNELRLAVTTALAPRALRIRMFGTAATDLVWLAEGRIDGCVTLSNNPWDTSAGVIIAREAGASVLDKDGSPHNFDSKATIAANPALAADLVRLVQAAEL